MTPGPFILLLIACAIAALVAGNYPAFFAVIGWIVSLWACRCHPWRSNRR